MTMSGQGVIGGGDQRGSDLEYTVGVKETGLLDIGFKGKEHSELKKKMGFGSKYL